MSHRDFYMTLKTMSRFHRICFVGGHLKYQSTSARPPPSISGKLGSRFMVDTNMGDIMRLMRLWGFDVFLGHVDFVTQKNGI